MAGEEVKNPMEWPKEATEASDFDFMMVGKDSNPIMKIKKQKLNEIIVVQGESMPAIQGGLTTAAAVALPAGPTGQNRWFDASWGYWKYNNVVLKNPLGTDGIPQGNEGTLYWDGTALTWKISKMQLLPQPEGTDEVVEGGTEVVNQNGVYQAAVKPLSQIVSETPNGVIVVNDTYTAPLYFSNTNVFSGFQFIYGKHKNFNQAIIKIGQIVGTSNPVTEVNFRICEDNYLGTELVRVTKSVNIPEGTIQDVVLDFQEILNTAEKNLSYEFWTNGKTGLFRGSLAAIEYRYKTTAQSYTDFKTQSNPSQGGALTAAPFYLVLKKTSTSYNLKPSLVAQKVDKLDDKPVSSKAVATSFDELSPVIGNVYTLTAETVIGATNVLINTSTFAGFGQLFGKLKNFNRVVTLIQAYDSANMPTYIELVIRKSGYQGEILFQIKKNLTAILNTSVEVFFDLPQVFTNADDSNIFMSFFGDGYFALIGKSGLPLPNGERVRYSSVKGVTSVNNPITSDSTLFFKLQNGTISKGLTGAEIERVKAEIVGFGTPSLLIPSVSYVYPGAPLDIFNENICVTDFGDNLENYRLDWNGFVGKQYNRGFRLYPATESLNSTISVTLKKGRDNLLIKYHKLLSAATNAGISVVRDVIHWGDSTGAGDGLITIPLQQIFSGAEPIRLNCKGTKGAEGTKHECTPGWTIENTYGPGPLWHRITVSGVSVNPTKGARYTQAGNVYNVEEFNISAGSGHVTLSVVSGSAPSNSGTLTKVSGTGDNTLNYSSRVQEDGNKAYDPILGKFSLSYFLSNTGITLSNNSWIIFQLGINDVFNITDPSIARAKVGVMISQLNEIIASIHSYDATIRVGIVITFPPSGQDGFGESYSLDQTAEMYKKTGLVEWQNKLIETYDNDTSRNNRIYLIPAHFYLDTVNNYPTWIRPVNGTNPNTIVMQNNGVHPDATGNKQIAYAIAGAIKYFQ